MRRAQKYIIGQRLGSGGVGVVYQATRVGSDRPLVIKFLHEDHADARARRRFRDEAVAGRLVHHPNVVSIIDEGDTEDGEHFIVMERACGESLGSIIRRERVLAVREAMSIAREILAGVSAMHELGIVHADIKCENVIVEPEPHRMVKLIDFGLARVQFLPDDARPNAAEEWLSGTPDYMAPEIIRGHGACFASDLYAVGVILYEMLTGAAPFAGGTPTEIVQRHLSDEVIPPSLRREGTDVPADLDRLVVRSLAKDPHDRFPSATAMSEALAAVRAPTDSHGRPRVIERSHDATPTVKWTRRRRFPRGTAPGFRRS